MGNTAVTPDTQVTAETPGSNHEESFNKLGWLFRRPGGPEGCSAKRQGHTLLSIIYVILCVILIIKAVVLISVAVSNTVLLKMFSAEESGRMAAMIIIAVTAAVVLTVSIYSMIGCMKRHNKPMHAAATTLFLLAIVLAAVVGVSVPVTKADEAHLAKSLVDSFRQSRVDPKTWSSIQNEELEKAEYACGKNALCVPPAAYHYANGNTMTAQDVQHNLLFSCCGVNGPEDYRALLSPRVIVQFPPNVPVSCCPLYDSAKPDILQEEQRENCKRNREYYKNGCTEPVLVTYKYNSCVVLMVTIGFIFLMVIQSIIATVIVKKNSLKEQPQVAELRTAEPKAPPPPQPLPQKFKAKLSMT